MALNSKKATGGGSISEPLEAGTYKGRVVQVIDLGRQPQNAFQGKAKAPAQMVMLTYELVDEFMKDEDGQDIEDKPRWISEKFVLHNLSADRAKSTIRLKALDPTDELDGDLTALLDIPCHVTVVRNESGGRVFANVASISAVRDRDKRSWPPLINSPIFFDLDNPSLEDFNLLPDWVKKIIQENLDFKGSGLDRLLNMKGESKPAASKNNNAKVPSPELDDEIPF